MGRVLILNPGSSSLKWSLLDAETEGQIATADFAYAEAGPENRGVLVNRALDTAGPVEAVGYRVVHGGMLFRSTVRVDSDMIASLATLNEMAPLHNPVAIECMTAALKARPEALHVAAFDTAFHRTLPEKAAIYAIPRDWTERWQIRRLGFHGLSVSYAVQQSARMLGQMPGRHVVCHLGAGCSVTAVQDGKSVDTSMGFTPLDGVMMATRSGAVDPGMLLYLVRHGVDVERFYDTLEHRSGMLGVSGVSSDVRRVLQAAAEGNKQAQLAYEMFVYSVTRVVGSMIAVLGGVDTLTFTGGVGEHQPPVRMQVAGSLACLGIRLNAELNESGEGDRDVSLEASQARVLVIKSREDLSILREINSLMR
jgi:acetate kinase